MTDPLSIEAERSKTTRLDIVAFFVVLVVGIVWYFTMRALGAPQWAITLGLVAMMLAYALTVALTPRLKIRLDQAGDNAYYLGLLYTLVSMAFALYDFGHQTATAGGVAERTAAIKIIGDFGIALATTITGIALRIVFQQMRVDPADMEGSTRIELAESAKRVKATLDSVSIEVGRLLSELQQRSSDQLKDLVDKAADTIKQFGVTSSEATKDLVRQLSEMQRESADKTASVTRALGNIAAEAEAATTRLRAVEAPPLEWQAKLTAAAAAFGTLASNADQAGRQMRDAIDASGQVTQAFAQTAGAIAGTINSARRDQDQAMQHLESGAARFAALLTTMADALERDRNELTNIEQNARQAADAATQVTQSATAVLERLVEITRGLVEFVNSRN